MMKPSKYIKEVLKTEASDLDEIDRRITGTMVTNHGTGGRHKAIKMTRLMHAAMGMVTESGELVDALKKFCFYGKRLDIQNIIEEVGDVLWYIAVALDILGVSFEDVMDGNIAKLRERYGEKFDNVKAIDRDTKKEMEALEGASQR